MYQNSRTKNLSNKILLDICRITILLSHIDQCINMNPICLIEYT